MELQVDQIYPMDSICFLSWFNPITRGSWEEGKWQFLKIIEKNLFKMCFRTQITQKITLKMLKILSGFQWNWGTQSNLPNGFHLFFISVQPHHRRVVTENVWKNQQIRSNGNSRQNLSFWNKAVKFGMDVIFNIFNPKKWKK